MRILIVSHEYAPNRDTGWGGIGTYVRTITPALVAAGNEVHVLTVARSHENRSYLDGAVTVHQRRLRRLRGAGRLTGLPHTVESLTHAANVYLAARRLREHFDVIECQSWRAEGLGLVARKLAPTVVRVHSLSSQILALGGFVGIDAAMRVRIEEASIRRADLVTCTSQGHADVVSEKLGIPKHRLRGIHNPVAVKGDYEAPSAGPPRILFVGRFEPRKSPETIVRAAPKILTEFPDARLVFVGTDSASGGHASYQAWMEETARGLGIRDAVEFVDGWQDGVVAGELRRAIICVVPSRSESFGYVAAEALAAGRAVVASRITGLSEIVEEGVTGHLVAAGDPSAWSEALLGLLRDQARARSMGGAGRTAMKTRFAPEEIAARLVDAYREAIENFRSSSRV